MRDINKLEEKFTSGIKFVTILVCLIVLIKIIFGIAISSGVIWLIITLIRYIGG